jgi:hypothetical protein
MSWRGEALLPPEARNFARSRQGRWPIVRPTLRLRLHNSGHGRGRPEGSVRSTDFENSTNYKSGTMQTCLNLACKCPEGADDAASRLQSQA